MKILYIITNLSTGGAEIQLLSLIKELRNTNEILVISLISKGEVGFKIEELGIPLHVLGLNNFTGLKKSVFVIKDILNNFKPDIIHTWMYHANLIGGFIPFLFGYKNIVWSIHHNSFSFKHNRIATVFLIRFSAILSYTIPRKIVCVSNDVIVNHRKIFYDSNKLCYIPNGIDTKLFCCRKEKKLHLSNLYNIKESTKLIGLISRFDPIKNHSIFLKSIKVLKNKGFEDFKIILCGKNIDYKNNELLNLISLNNLQDHIILLGLFEDMQLLYNSLDLVVCTSFSESFSIVLAEAISCGTLCVSTILGDPENFLTSYQHIKNPYDEVEIANVILANLNVEDKTKITENLRLELIKKYSIDVISKKYFKLYQELVS
jgi:glycosyltransferase involved in cell wall biosynthesis